MWSDHVYGRWSRDECPLDSNSYYKSTDKLFLHEGNRLEFNVKPDVITIIPAGTIFFVSGIITSFHPNVWSGARDPFTQRVELMCRVDGEPRTLEVPWRAWGHADGIHLPEIATRLVPYNNPLMCLAMSAGDSPV